MDYTPSTDRGKIRARLLAIDFANDEVNAAEFMKSLGGTAGMTSRRGSVMAVATCVAVFTGAVSGLIGRTGVAAQAARNVWEGVYSEAQAARGKKLYVNSCAVCHQEGLQGADLAPALKGDDFMLRWSDQSMYDLFNTIATTMPGDGPGSLSPQVNADIVAFLLQTNRFPAGKDDLTPDATGLRAIAITKQAPAR